jgi:hypothetical protein
MAQQRFLMIVVVALATGCATTSTPTDPFAKQSLFDGKSLAGWSKSDYLGGKMATVKDGVLHLPMGSPISGIRRPKLGSLPVIDYEIELEAQRVEGSDFFLGLTFPVQKSSCTLVLGGWGGQLSGLSNIDNFDASENVSTQAIEYKNKKWYRIRMRVMKHQMVAWIDDEILFNIGTKHRSVGIRIEMEESLPFGIACYATEGAYRNMTIRKLRLDEPTPPKPEFE